MDPQIAVCGKNYLLWGKRGMKRLCVTGMIFLLFMGTASLPGPIVIASADPGKTPDVPAKGMVTMVDLGAKSCVPCKMMAPILEKL